MLRGLKVEHMFTDLHMYIIIRVSRMLASAIWSLKTQDKALHKCLSHDASSTAAKETVCIQRAEEIKLEKPQTSRVQSYHCARLRF